MKAKFSESLKLIAVAIFFQGFVSCKKSGETQGDSSTFTWSWGGTNYTGNFKEAFLQSMSITPIIISGTGYSVASPGTGPRISVSSFTVGNYTLSTGLPNTISFIAPNGDNLQSTSGSLSITQNSNNKMAGNFSAALINAGGQTSALSGSFTNLKISQ